MATFLAVLFVIICVLLIVVVLLQKGRGGGLSAAFGGGGHTAFGTRTGDVFTWVTIVLVGVFLLLAVVASLVFRAEPEPMEPPFFAPAAGPISRVVHVTIQSNTPRAEIHFTTDGSDPTQSSVIYDGTPVRVVPGTVLKARAYRRGFKPSEAAVGAYVQAAPATTTAPTTATAPATTTTATAATATAGR